MKRELCAQHDGLGMVGEEAAAVAERQLLPAQRPHAVREKRRDLGEHILQLAAVGARVHHHAAAETAGNAVRELQSREAVLPGKNAQPRERYARVRRDDAAVERDTVQPLARLNDERIQALVRNEQIGAVAEQERRDAALLCEAREQNDLLAGGRERHARRRPSDAEGCVPRKRLVVYIFEVRQIRRDLFIQ